MKPPCPVCRALPKGLRDWLLDVFASGNTDDSLFGIVEQYARWGAARLARGESVAFPLESHRPSDLDPFEVYRERMKLGLAEFSYRPYAVNRDGTRVRAGTIPQASSVEAVRRLAVIFDSDERKVRRALDTAKALLKSYGPEFECNARMQLLVGSIRPNDPLAGKSCRKP